MEQDEVSNDDAIEGTIHLVTENLCQQRKQIFDNASNNMNKNKNKRQWIPNKKKNITTPNLLSAFTVDLCTMTAKQYKPSAIPGS